MEQWHLISANIPEQQQNRKRAVSRLNHHESGFPIQKLLGM
jgi:hypothetical protein